MKKLLPILLLIIVIVSSGCGREDTVLPQTTPTAETPEEAEAAVTPEIDIALTPEIAPEQSALPAEQADDELAKYMAAIESQAEQINTALSQAMTQMEMNAKAGELYNHWDSALNYLWGELKDILHEDEFSVLLEEQLVWIAEKEASVAEIGKQFQGGSAYSMAVSLQGAEITKERVYQLYELLKQAKTK